ncbi:MAG: DNA-processing protein DprA [Longimicrobiales bacterium]
MDSLTPRDSRGPVAAVDLVALGLLPGAGCVAVQRALEHFGTARRAMEAGVVALAPAIGLTPRRLRDGGYPHDVRRKAAVVLQTCADRAIDVVTVEMASYPDRLRQLHDPPPFLFLRGDASLLERRAVAIVGSRRSTSYGRRTADELAGALARAGVVVVSGMALGIDGAAHRGCLAAGGATVAVLGSGPDVLSPSSHAGLGRQILRTGLVVSEFLPGDPPRAHHFPRRNRVLAALADAVVVVEAGARSGALITVGHALDLGRDVFAVPGPLGTPSSQGSNALIRDGAGMITSVAEFVAAVTGDEPAESVDGQGEPANVGREALELWRALEAGAVDVDRLAHLVRLTPAQVLAGLAELEVVGWAVRDGGMRFRRSA